MHDTILKPVGAAPWPPAGDHVLLRTETGLLVAELHGDIDLATAAHLSLWFDSLAAVAAPGYVVDLRPVTFIDSAGLNVVLRLRRRVTGTGSGFALVCDTAQLRLLRANGTADVLNPSATLAEAVSGLLPLRDGPLPARSGPNRSARGPAAG